MTLNLALWAILIVLVAFIFGPWLLRPLIRDVQWRWRQRRRRRAPIELPLGKRRLP